MNKKQLLLTPKNRERLRRNSTELGIARTTYPKPQSGKQALFYNCPADVSFFGGAAGSGKSASLLLDFGKEEYVDKPGYTAVIFRKTYPELTNPGGLVDDSFRFYSGIGELTMKPLEWKFPRGGKICFRHIQHENDVYSYQGSQIARIGFDELTHFCLTPEVEVLTKSGWKQITEIKGGEQVASYSKDRQIEYMPCIPLSFDYDGKMIVAKNNSLEMKVTPNHRIVQNKQLPVHQKTKGKYFSDWKFSKAEDSYGKRIHIPRTGNFKGTEVEVYNIPLVKNRGIGRNANIVQQVKMDDWLRFLGWYFSEGCAFENINPNAVTKRGSPVMSIRQTKPDHLDEIRSMLDALGFRWKEWNGRFDIFSRQLYEELIQYGKGAKNKRIPRWVFNLSPRQINIFLDAFVKGDGYIGTSNEINIGLCNEGLIDDLQELYFLVGKVATKGGYVTQTGFDVHSLYVSQNNQSTVIAKNQWSKEDYQGKVYCLSVEKNGTFLVRHKGRYFWTGNSESVFWYMFSRNRSLSGVKPQIRATMNPDADSWVAKFIEWYINPETGYPIEERCGVLRWFIRKHEEIIWGDSREELVEKYPESTPKSFTFISATVYDNKLLLDANPEYVSNLEALHPVERERLLKGNWKIRYESGTVFDRSWFKPLNKIPADWVFKGRVRFWDLAATAKEVADTKTCYSAGLLLSKYECMVDIGNYQKKETVYIIEDLLHEQKKAGDVEMMVSSVATIDGQKTMIRWELEGGSSGKIVENKLREDVLSKHPSFNVRAIKPMGDKLTRCLAAAQTANQGKIYFLTDGTWNNKFLNAVQSFDGTRRAQVNDIVDSFSGAFNTLIAECNYQVPESGMSTVKLGDSRMRPARRYR